MEVHRLINEQRFQDAAREALELAVMGREDPRGELAIQAITIKARPQIKGPPQDSDLPPLPRSFIRTQPGFSPNPPLRAATGAQTAPEPGLRAARLPIRSSSNQLRRPLGKVVH